MKLVDLSIDKKLGALSGLLLASLLIVGITGFRNIVNLDKHFQDVGNVQLVAVRNLSLADMTRDGLRAVAFRAIIAAQSNNEQEKTASREEFREVSENFRICMDKIDALPLGVEIRQAIANARPTLDAYLRSAKELMDLSLSADSSQALSAFPRFQIAFKEMKEAMANLGDLIERDARASVAHANKTGASARRASIVIMVLGAMVSIFLCVLISRSITRPLTKMIEAADRLAVGDVEQSIAIDGKDEIGHLASSFRRMIDAQKQLAWLAAQIAAGNTSAQVKVRSEKDVLGKSFQQLAQTLQDLIAEVVQYVQWSANGQLDKRGNTGKFQGAYRELVQGVNNTLDSIITPVNEAAVALEKVANRDLTVRVTGDYQGGHARIKNALNQAVENLDNGLSHVAISAEQVAAASGQISAGSQSLAQSASEQASTIQEVSISLQEMSSMTKQNAANAKEARSLSNGARASAERGVESMNRLSQAIDKIKESSNQTAKIVKTIDEIAFQTNLLALNAAVEAARAGDAGKGFAVVADEVRNLAMRSAEAAKNTATMIETSVKNAEGGVAINQEVLTNLKEISEQVDKVTEVMAEIAAASDQQSQGVDQITTAVEQMNQVTLQAAANAEESASGAEELSIQSAEMQNMVASFKLSETQQASTPTAIKKSAVRLQPQARPASMPARVVNDVELGRGKVKGAGKRFDAKKLIPLHDDDRQTLADF